MGLLGFSQAASPSMRSGWIFNLGCLRKQLDFQILRDGRARRLALAQLTSAGGDAMVIAVLSFAIVAGGGTDAEFSVALAVQMLTMVLLFLPAGVIGDRFNRRNVVVAADLMRFGARAAFALLLIVGEASFWQLLVAQAVNGAGTALFTTAMDGFMPEVISGEKRLLKINAMRFLALSLGMTLGPAAGGFFYSEFGAAATFGLDAGTFLVSALLIWNLPTPFARRTSKKPVALRGLFQDVAEGWSAFWKIGWFWRVATAFALFNACVFAPYFVIGPHVARESLGGAWAWSLILVGMGAGQFLGALAAMAWEPRRPLVSATSIIALWTFPLLALAFVAPVGVLVATAACAGIACSMFGSVWETVKQSHTPVHLRARLGSLDHLGGLGLVPFGYLLGAAALATIGATAGLGVAALLLVGATVWVTKDVGVRELKSDDELDRAERRRRLIHRETASEVATAPG